MAPSSVFVKAAVAVAAFSSSAAAAVAVVPTEYQVSDVYQGQTFFDQFTFNDNVDPTHGFVDFKGYDAALSQGLISVNNAGQAYLGVDSKTVLTNLNERGRASVRLESKKLYNGGLFIADIAHMPSSVCGVWPAFWTSGQQNWPEDGEIDIIENISEAEQNAVTLHTGTKDCTISKSAQGGTLVTSHCSNYFSDSVTQWPNQGCSVQSTDSSNNYGDTFNSVGGGIYALEWTGASIKIWNFLRNSADGINALSAHPDPSTWAKKPTISTVGGSCDVAQQFKNHNMIIDTTFCGDYAGQDVFWQATSCYKSNPAKYPSCASYVAANPSKYEKVSWLINSVKVYQLGPKTAPTSTKATSTKATSTKATSTKATSTKATSTKAASTTAKATSITTKAAATSSTGATTSARDASTSKSSDVHPTTPISLSSTGSYANSSMAAPTTYPTLTSTVVTTSVYTITSCAPTVTNCPVGHVTTDIITQYTTYCPGNPTYTPVPTTTAGPSEYTTSTIYTTSIMTVTKCPPIVTNCPAHSTVVVTSTYAVSTTVCPVTSAPTNSGAPGGPVVIPPYGSGNGTSPAGPTGPAGPANPTKTSGPVQPSKPVSPLQPSGPVFGSSAGRIGASMSALLGVAALALLL